MTKRIQGFINIHQPAGADGHPEGAPRVVHWNGTEIPGERRRHDRGIGITQLSQWWMDYHDYIWLYMIIYDYIWLYMIIYDYIWLYMIIFDYIWLKWSDSIVSTVMVLTSCDFAWCSDAFAFGLLLPLWFGWKPVVELLSRTTRVKH